MDSIPSTHPENGVIRVYNPATLQFVSDVRTDDPGSVTEKVARSHRAQLVWTAMPLKERISVLGRAQEVVGRKMEEIARTIHSETGKPRLEAVANDVMAGLGVGDFALNNVHDILRPRKMHLGKMDLPMRFLGRRSYMQARPLGVIGIIAPWNYPFGIPYSQTIMALAAGNSVILKPSSYTPLTGQWVRDIFTEAGVPEDLVQTVIGAGGPMGKVLLASDVQRIIFTGSSATGREIMRLASQSLTPVTLELGGKDPMVVFADADMERAVRGAVWGSFVNAGQTCACVKRILVQESEFEAFSKAMKERVEALKIGNGWDDDGISMGPLINAEAATNIDSMVKRAVAQGATILTGGGWAEGMNGNFYRPTVLTHVRPEMEAFQEEAFGPLAVLVPFKDEEDALRLCWNNRYALAASVWTRDLVKGRRVAERMPGGSVLINNVAYTYGLGETPWGGSKESGLGRTHGQFGFLELVDFQHIHEDKAGYAQDPWWSPYDREKSDLMKDMVSSIYSGSSSLPLPTLFRMRRVMKK